MMKWICSVFLLCMMSLFTACSSINSVTDITFHDDLTGTWDTVIASDEPLSKQEVVNVLSAVPVQGYQLWGRDEEGHRKEKTNPGDQSYYWEMKVKFRSEEELNRMVHAVHRASGRGPERAALQKDENGNYLFDMGAAVGKTIFHIEGGYEKITPDGEVKGDTITFHKGENIRFRLYKTPWWKSYGALLLIVSLLCVYVIVKKYKK